MRRACLKLRDGGYALLFGALCHVVGKSLERVIEARAQEVRGRRVQQHEKHEQRAGDDGSR